MALHTGGTVYSWELCGEADRVTQDCQCSTCAHVRGELTPEELAALPSDKREASTMYERVQLNTANRVLDWNGPFASIEEAREEAHDLASDYRGIGRTIASIDPCSFYVLDSAGREPIRVIVRPIA